MDNLPRTRFRHQRTNFSPGSWLGWVALLVGVLLPTAQAQSIDLFVSNIGNGSIVRLSPTGGSTPFIQTNIGRHIDLAIGPDGDLYVATIENGKLSSEDGETIYKVDKAGKPAVFARGLHGAGMLAFDASGTLYTGAGEDQLYKISPTGSVTTLKVSGISHPIGLAFNANGTLFVSDTTTGSVSRVDPTTGAVTTFAQGLNGPFGLAFDQSGNIFVANFGDNTVARLSSAGVATLFARIPQPSALAFSTVGDLYVISAEESVFKVNKLGEVSSFAQGAELKSPRSLAFDHPLLKPAVASSESTLPIAKPETGLIVILIAPAIILLVALVIWLMRRKPEENK